MPLEQLSITSLFRSQRANDTDGKRALRDRFRQASVSPKTVLLSTAPQPALSVFQQGELTDKQLRTIEENVAAHQEMRRQHEQRILSRAIGDVQRIAPYLTEEESKRALYKCDSDPERVCATLMTDPLFLHSLRKEIALAAMEEAAQALRNSPPGRHRKLPRAPKKLSAAERERQDSYKYERLLLDQALERIRNVNFTESALLKLGWSPARIKAYQQREKNPNSFYYRFNDPGEAQKNGPFTKEEKALFLKRMEVCKVVGNRAQWGIFSQGIPGRVGYQCSNYYRKLIEQHEITDPNYYIDRAGKAHFLFSGKIIQKSKYRVSRGEGEEEPVAPKRSEPARWRARPEKRRKKSVFSSDESETDLVPDDDAPQYKPTAHTTRMPRYASCGVSGLDLSQPTVNPLPGWTDPITLEEITTPAISPFGHVMDYDSWCRCLAEGAEICPFTKRPLKKSQLVLLTMENIDDYREGIVAATGV